MNREHLVEGLMAFASVLVTPLALLISTSSALYLSNQEKLNYQVSVLFPFLEAALGATALGLVLLVMARRFRLARFLLWVYYLAGPIYFFYSIPLATKPDMANSFAVMASFLAVYGVCAVVCFRKVDMMKARAILATAGLGLLVYEGYLFSAHAESNPATKSILEALDYAPGTPLSEEQSRLPNVYHIILDQYMGDMFDLLVAEEERERTFEGFTYFPDTVAQYGKTLLSIRSVFLGQMYDRSITYRAWLKGQFDSERSFLHPLVEAGYETFGFHYPQPVGNESLFHHAVRHREHATTFTGADARTFRALWVVSSLPARMAARVLGGRSFRELNDSRAMSAYSPMQSYGAFKNYLAIEKVLPAHGRYTYMHYLVPHPPYVMQSDCTPRPEGQSGDGINENFIEQSECATKMMLDFLSTLKDLDRYDDSLIIIHSDHGDVWKAVQGNLWRRFPDGESGWSTARTSEARSDALLLIKPPATSGFSREFQVSTAPASLLDIAPTVLGVLGIEASVDYEGYNLLGEETLPLERKRYYHWYDDDINIVEMTRWTIQDGVASEGTIVRREDYWLSEERLDRLRALTEEQQEELKKLRALSAEERERLREMVESSSTGKP